MKKYFTLKMDYSKWTVVKLKAELKKQNISFSGITLKKELIKCLEKGTCDDLKPKAPTKAKAPTKEKSSPAKAKVATTKVPPKAVTKEKAPPKTPTKAKGKSSTAKVPLVWCKNSDLYLCDNPADDLEKKLCKKCLAKEERGKELPQLPQEIISNEIIPRLSQQSLKNMAQTSKQNKEVAERYYNKYALITFDQPFGNDAFYHLFVQINGNEKALKSFHTIMKNEEDGIYFGKTFTEKEVDMYMDLSSFSHFPQIADHVNIYKLSGCLKLPIHKKNTNAQFYFEDICGKNIKFPDFSNVAEQVIDNNEVNHKERDEIWSSL